MYLISGGAQGSDTLFASLALQAGIKVDIKTFAGHHYQTPSGAYEAELLRISQISDRELYNTYHHEIIPISKLLNRHTTRKQYIQKLLARDYFEVCSVDEVYGVGTIEQYQPFLKVEGGTGYAICVAQKLHVPRIYFYEVSKSTWWFYEFNKEFGCYDIYTNFGTGFAHMDSDWKREYKPIPGLSRKEKYVAGIGTRFIKPEDICAFERAIEFMKD